MASVLNGSGLRRCRDCYPLPIGKGIPSGRNGSVSKWVECCFSHHEPALLLWQIVLKPACARPIFYLPQQTSAFGLEGLESRATA